MNECKYYDTTYCELMMRWYSPTVIHSYRNYFTYLRKSLNIQPQNVLAYAITSIKYISKIV